MNNITLVGNTTREVEKRFFPKSGKPYVRFGVATNKKWVNGETGEVVDKTMFIDVVCYTSAEHIEKYVKKGDKVGIVGELALDMWNDENGNKKSKHYIIARSVEFLTPKSNEQTQPQASMPPMEHNPNLGDGAEGYYSDENNTGAGGVYPPMQG